jgi:hypothetical protein
MTRLTVRLQVTAILLGTAPVLMWLGSAGISYAQSIPLPPLPSWFPPVWKQSLEAPRPSNTQPGRTPGTIPQFSESNDPSGGVATYQPGGRHAERTDVEGRPAGLGPTVGNRNRGHIYGVARRTPVASPSTVHYFQSLTSARICQGGAAIRAAQILTMASGP